MNLNCSKKTLLTGLCSILLLGYSSAMYAGGTYAPLEVQQTKKITGTVSDAMGPVIGASVVIKGTSNGVATDFDGNFTLQAKQGQTLVISYIGYLTKEIKIDGRTNYQITLEEDKKMLDEVVVVGYGTMKRSDLTGSVSSIDEKAIKQGVNTNVEQAMQGRIAGVQVTQNSGAPGGGISVQIRGINSLNGGNEPLYVIDGIAVSGQTDGNTSVLSTINPADITSIEVLKDASATAIYGSRASNGVVLITTKKGQDSRPQVSYEGYVGWQSIIKKLDVMNLKEYADYYNTRSKVYGWGTNEQYLNPDLLTDGTNWQDELFRTAVMHNHQVNINGGTKSTHYSISGGYLNQDGIAIGSSFERVTFRVNFDTEINKWLSFNANVAFANIWQESTFDQWNIMYQALASTPDMAAHRPDGSYDMGSSSMRYNYTVNPLFMAERQTNERTNQSLDYNFAANIKPVKGLNIRIEYGGNRGWGKALNFVPEYKTWRDGNIFTYPSANNKYNSTNKYNSFKQYATYEIEPLKDNRFSLMLGHESQDGEWYQGWMYRGNYISGALTSIAVGDADTAKNNEEGNHWSIESYFGRFNYNFKERYLLTATLRTDGSSHFAKGHRWGWFPSVALAWRITQEPFMKKVTWLSNAKIRLGWGLVGNQNAAEYAYGVKMKNVTTSNGTAYVPANYGNEDLTWEKTRAWNIGLDLAFLNNRIEFITDAYWKTTDDLLMSAVLPNFLTGLTPAIVNAGSMKNRGVEFTLNTVNINNKDFQWRSGLTVSFNKNELSSLNSADAALPGKIPTGQGSDPIVTWTPVGGAVGRFYGYNVIGMFTCEDDFYQKNQLGEFVLDANGNRVPVARPVATDGSLMPINPNNGIWVGDYIYEDVNQDGKITEADRKFIGDPNPTFTFGFNNVITWKDFELSFFFNGSVGNDAYNYIRQQFSDPSSWGNRMKDVFDFARIALKDENGSTTDISNVYISNASSAKVQRITQNPANDNNRVSSRFIENASYLRLKSLSLSWNVPKKWLAPLKVDWVQVYANVQNLFTITNYKGYDPELGSINQTVTLQGIDNYRYPSQRIYNVGLKVRF